MNVCYINTREPLKLLVQEKIKEHFAYVHIALAITWHKVTYHMGNMWQTKVGFPDGLIQTATCAIVNHADVLIALLHIKVME